MTFDHRHYVPVLLTKRGERSALGDVAQADKDRMTPLFVVPPADWNFDTGAPSKSIDEHVKNTGRDIYKCWGPSSAFIDLQFIDDTARMADGSHPLTWVITEAARSGARLIPAVSPSRHPVYLAAAAAAVASDGNGACFRLPPDEWPSATSTGPLTALLTQMGVAPSAVDLVLDLGEEIVGAPSLSLTAARNELGALPHVLDWRSVTIAGAGFPKQLTGVARGLSTIERLEWTLYRGLLSGPTLPRTPTFGDYGIAHPDPVVDVDPKFMNISAAIRYTIDDAWLVAKGDLFKGNSGRGIGGAAAIPLAALLAGDSRFAGPAHCSGDDWIQTTSTSTTGGGNPEAWRRVGTTHHLTHVSQAVASLP